MAPTKNKHCEDVRHAVATAKRGFNVHADDLALAMQHAEGARQLLAMAYKLLTPHYTLSVACETAGKSARNLVASIEARQVETSSDRPPLNVRPNNPMVENTVRARAG